jgi:hypothetical protein
MPMKQHAETALQTATTALTQHRALNACPTFSYTQTHASFNALWTSSRTQPIAFPGQKSVPHTVPTALLITCVSSVQHSTSFFKTYATVNAPQGIEHQEQTLQCVKCSFHLNRRKAFLLRLSYVRYCSSSS